MGTSGKETHPRAEVLLAKPGVATEEQTAADIVETFCDHVPVQEQDLICPTTSVRQQDLMLLDAAPNVVDVGKDHVHVPKSSAGVFVQAQELAGISFERSPSTPATNRTLQQTSADNAALS